MSTATRKPPKPRDYGPIQAVQLTRENGPEVWEWADSKPYYEPDGAISGLTIFTSEGRVKADFGNWVIREPGGSFRVAATYEPMSGHTEGPAFAAGGTHTTRENTRQIG